MVFKVTENQGLNMKKPKTFLWACKGKLKSTSANPSAGVVLPTASLT
jgi:hypothetical protein